MIRFLAVLAMTAAFGVLSPGHALAATPPSGRVVVFGVPDLQWRDISRAGTPTLWRLAERGSVGALSVRTFGFATTCAEGWLTVGAGTRATAHERDDEPRLCGDDLKTLLRGPHRADVYRINRRTGFAAHPDALALALRRAGMSTAALGDAGASVALAQSAPLSTNLPTGPGSVAVVASSGLFNASPKDRAAVLRAVDAEAGALAATLTPADTLLVIGPSDRLHGQPHLHVAIAVGPTFDRGSLRSASTGRAPFVQLIDVAPTILARDGIALPPSMAGRPWLAAPRRVALQRTVENLVDIDDAAHASSVTGRSFHLLYAVLASAVFLAAALILRLTREPRALSRTVRFAALGLALLPVASFAAQATQWWHSNGAEFYAFIAAFCIGGAAAATWLGRRFGEWAAIAAVAFGTSAILVGDMLTGGRLQISAVMGDSPLVAGRFHGVGNVDFALISTTGLLSAACAAHALRRAGRDKFALPVAALITFAVIAVDGLPQFGDDFGGVLALAPAVLVLLAVVGRWRVSLGRALLAVLAALIPATAFALYDYSLPASRQTHIGRFVGQVLHGGAMTVVRRKALANAHQLLNPLLLWPMLAAIVLTVVLLVGRRGQPAPLARALSGHRELTGGFIAVLICAVLGGVLNDSGLGITVAAAVVALSLAVRLALAPVTP